MQFSCNRVSEWVCEWVCEWVWVSECVWVCECVSECVWVSVCEWVCVYESACKLVNECVWENVSVYERECAWVSVYMINRVVRVEWVSMGMCVCGGSVGNFRRWCMSHSYWATWSSRSLQPGTPLLLMSSYIQASNTAKIYNPKTMKSCNSVHRITGLCGLINVFVPNDDIDNNAKNFKSATIHWWSKGQNVSTETAIYKHSKFIRRGPVEIQ